MRRKLATSSQPDQRTANTAKRHTPPRTADPSAAKVALGRRSVFHRVPMNDGHSGGDQRVADGMPTVRFLP